MKTNALSNMFAKSGAARNKAKLVTREFKVGKLHSGSKHGPIVTNPAQKTAIMLSQSRKAAGRSREYGVRG